jgi:uncharacterized RDD family membrane protein YckC
MDVIAAPAGIEQRIATPEGMPLTFHLAGISERFLAFAIDATIIFVSCFLLLLLLALTFGGHGPGGAIVAGIVLLLFFARVFYFPWFEVRWQGMTPGKRMLRLRVIRADGGQLTTEAVLARNFTRELELFLPLGFLLAPDAFWPGQPGWLRLLAGGWILMLLFFPLMNKGRMRVGDLVAGTRVISSPQSVLLRDLSIDGLKLAQAGDDRPIAFTREQLDVYGIYELQVLEDVLRKASAPGGRETVEAVAGKIQKRIGWQADAGVAVSHLRFLRDFYSAQRRHLEQKLLFGERQDRKRQPTTGTPKPPRIRGQ